MKKGIIKLGVLSLLFVVSLFIISKLYNRGNADLTTTMKEASYPIAYFEFKEQPINFLHGYANEMEANYMRDSLTIMGEDRVLPLVIKDFGSQLKGLSFEVRSLDTKRLVESTKVNDYKLEQGVLRADLPLKNLLENGQDYILILNLEMKENTIHYYTRIRQETEEELNEISSLLTFVQEFHGWTLEDGHEDKITTYLETNAKSDNSSLHYVDIHSSCEQVTFGNLEIQELDKPRVSIKEYNPVYGIFTISYTVTTPGADGDTEYYNVEEFYRVKKTSERVVLLNFQRNMEEIFIGDNHIINNGEIQLGIGDKDIEFKGNEKGSVVCFEKEGELWSYKQESNELIKVFGFRSGEGIDERENWQQHEIQIINVDENGSIDFLVCGYMNRGTHEGKVGIAVYHYDTVTNTVEEEVFIPSTKSYQVLKEEVGELLYVNEDNKLFLILDGVFYTIDLNTREMKVIAENLKTGCYAASQNGQMIGWLTDNEINSSQELKVLNLNNLSEYLISISGKEYLRPLGFVGTDIVYGIAKEEDITKDITGKTVFPMYSVNIMNQKKEVVKEYKQAGCYVVSAQIEDNNIKLKRVSKGESISGFTKIGDDQIVSNSEASEDKVKLQSTVSDLKKKEIQIAMANEIEENQPKIVISKEVLLNEERTIELSNNGTKASNYLVYAKGKVVLKTNLVNEAIPYAQDQIGVVVGDRQQYIWERGNLLVRTQLEGLSLNQTHTVNESLGVCLTLMCQKKGRQIDAQKLLGEGGTVLSILKENINADVLSLSGCTLDEVLYFVSKGNPVLAMTDKEHAVLIVGYDELNISILDPVKGNTYKVGRNDSRTMFEGTGNVFVSYIN
ncbi:hypothetical protein [Anaerosacchariphilus polymeriproducens]|uniref:Peptidase C39-like domain-containing protein n=1 Tax=Anaerosacchariphilus polymeriproducens TaxID=1812858 RepID=A0A371AZX4_9FIRM|nr:hypothetical protein [Anaerosacchariphilus polymeriproducens]RDU25099.1 hypothetical protein DWV06_00960 [Anaerosacchariphilus polymeriproducens]